MGAHTKIPKIIHQMWVGEEKAPQHLMDQWKLKGWKYMLWDENNIRHLKNQAAYNHYYKNKLYAGASNIVRYEVLNTFGGLWIDADTRRLKNIPTRLLEKSFVAGLAHSSFEQPYRVGNGIMGTTPDHPILKEVMKRINPKDLEPSWQKTGGTLLTQVILDTNPDHIDMLILEPWVFYPRDSWGTVHPRASEALTEHLWGSRGGVYG